MADPRQELADIIAPAAPEVLAAGGSPLAGWAAAALVILITVILLAWAWHRRRPARALRAIATAAAQRQGALPTLAGRLDTWARAVFKLTRVEAVSAPSGIDPAAWAEWARALEALRFAPSPPEGHAKLAQLCEQARVWRRHA